MTKDIPYICRHKNGTLYLNIRVPNDVAHYYSNPHIQKSLRTREMQIGQPKMEALVTSLQEEWHSLRATGTKSDEWEHYRTLILRARMLDFPYTPISKLQLNNDLRTRVNVASRGDVNTARAVLGTMDRPPISWSAALEEYLKLKQDHTLEKSPDQYRRWKTPMESAVKQFIQFSGDISFESTTKRHAIDYRQSIIEKVKAGILKAASGNKLLTHLRKIYTAIADVYEITEPNPFARVRLEEVKRQTRFPFARDFVQNTLLAKKTLGGTNIELCALVYIAASTGMRPVEILGLDSDDIQLDHEVPHVILRPNKIRTLKTEFSDRKIPILGTAYGALSNFPNGFDRYRGRNDGATAALAKYLRENETLAKGQSLYSLRHTFQDGLTRGVDIYGTHSMVPDRIQTQLMGHKFDRPIYGDGARLEDLQNIIRNIAFYLGDNVSFFPKSDYQG